MILYELIQYRICHLNCSAKENVHEMNLNAEKRTQNKKKYKTH